MMGNRLKSEIAQFELRDLGCGLHVAMPITPRRKIPSFEIRFSTDRERAGAVEVFCVEDGIIPVEGKNLKGELDASSGRSNNFW